MLLIPENPYPHFYLGQVQKRQGLIDLARASFERSMSLDEQKPPDPYFRQALELMNKPMPALAQINCGQVILYMDHLSPW